MKKILNMSNHTLTGEQIAELSSMGYEVVELTAEDKALWGQMNPSNYKEFIYRVMEDSDTRYAVDAYHIAGFPPAVVNAVCLACTLNMPALYAYSERVSEEVHQPDGTVKKVNVFKHLGFFNY
ncbi:MAG: hypothetical protein ACLT40_00460 [Fusobacterium sp.]